MNKYRKTDRQNERRKEQQERHTGRNKEGQQNKTRKTYNKNERTHEGTTHIIKKNRNTQKNDIRKTHTDNHMKTTHKGQQT